MVRSIETNTNDGLKLENQLCFPLYVCAKEVVRKYTPFLEKLGLTYTQYIVMIVMWEQEKLTVKELGKYLYLDSGTLTPLLKKLEKEKLLQRTRDPLDERNVHITLTPSGKALKKHAVSIPNNISSCIPLSIEDAQELYTLLYKLLKQL